MQILWEKVTTTLRLRAVFIFKTFILRISLQYFSRGRQPLVARKSKLRSVEMRDRGT